MEENTKPLTPKIALGTVFIILIFLNIRCKAPLLSARIEVSKDTLILGEEFRWNLIVKNESKTPISIFYDPRGNYHNELNRDSDLRLVLRDTFNNIIDQIYTKRYDIIINSGRVGFQELKKGDELKFPQWFTDWYLLDKAGKYTLEIEKPLIYGKNFIDNKKLTIKTNSKQIYFYPQNSEERIKIIRNLEQQYRSKSYTGWEESDYALQKIIRSKDEGSLDFYVELLNSKNISTAAEMLRAIGKLSPSPKAFQVLVKHFDMGFETSMEDSGFVKNNKQSVQEYLYFITICEIEQFPPEMTIYFLNKVAASDKYGKSAKWKAIQIMH